MKKINNIKKKEFIENNFQSAFSLMEMMVVLLIVAIIAAATAPMVTKKLTRNAGTGDSPWVFTGVGTEIAYVNNVNIGNFRRPNGVGSLLYIEPNNNDYISFGAGNAERAHLRITENSIGLNDNNNIGDNSVAIGINAQVGENSTAIGQGAQAMGATSLAIGLGARAAQQTAVAIGPDARANAVNAVAIGPNVQNNRDNTIQIGTGIHTVYIPGDLVVRGNVVFANSNSLYMTHEDHWYQQIGRSKPSEDDRFFMEISDEAVVLPQRFVDVLSDRRLKDVGEKYVAGIDELKKLDFFHYTFKKDKKKTPHVGVMAQDLQKVFPDAVTEGSDGFLRIRMEDMFYAVINAVKELDTKIAEICAQVKTIADDICSMKKTIETQQEEIKELKKQNKDLEKQISEFDKRLKKLEKKEK